MIYQLKTTDLPMETIFSTFLDKQINYQQMMEKENEIEYTNSFIQMNQDGF